MYAVLLAAGKGSRMGALSESTSKTMIEIHGKPKLAYTIEQLPDEITHVVIVVGHFKEHIKDYFKETYDGKEILYIEQTILNGTDGALRVCESVLQGQEKFLVLNGDDLYIKQDLARMMRYTWAVLAYYSYDAKKFGIISIDDNDNFEGLMEKSEHHSEGLIQCGAFVLGFDFFSSTPVAVSGTEFGLPHTILSMYKSHPTRVIHTDNWLPVGTPEQLEEAIDKISEFN